MEGMAEMVQDVGLAQSIQGGLPKGQMSKPKFPDDPTLEAKKSAVSGGDKMAVWNSPLGMYLLQHYATQRSYNLATASSGRRASSAALASADAVYSGGPPTAETLGSYWEEFTATVHFTTYCKYMCLQETTAAEPITPKLFEEMRPLGKGAFGAVFLVFKKDTGMAMAVKKMKKKIAKQNKMLKDILIEREVLSKVQSRFCVSLYYAWQNDDDVALVITLMPGGDLEFMMKGREVKGEYNPMDMKMIQYYAASMALGLGVIHEMGYVYRDLKPMNVLLDGEGQVRVSDMGLTANITGGPIKQCSGTRGYWSPETIQKQMYTTEPDWWSLGVTMFVLFCHKLPFFGSDEEKDAMSVAGVIDFKHGEPDELKKIISDLCMVDQKGRTKGVDALKAHPFYSGFDWAALEQGKYDAPFKPNVNDINAPSSSEIDAFKAPKDVVWGDEEKEKFKTWEFYNKVAWEAEEAKYRIEKFKELTGGGGGGGGCCTIA